MAYFTSQTKKEIQDLIKDFGFSSKKEFISKQI